MKNEKTENMLASVQFFQCLLKRQPARMGICAGDSKHSLLAKSVPNGKPARKNRKTGARIRSSKNEACAPETIYARFGIKQAF